MKTITIDADHVFYDAETDILFASFGDYDPSLIDHETSTGDGVYVQYAWPGGEIAFMEVWGFSARKGSPYVEVDIGNEVRVLVPAIEGASSTLSMA